MKPENHLCEILVQFYFMYECIYVLYVYIVQYNIYIYMEFLF